MFCFLDAFLIGRTCSSDYAHVACSVLCSISSIVESASVYMFIGPLLFLCKSFIFG